MLLIRLTLLVVMLASLPINQARADGSSVVMRYNPADGSVVIDLVGRTKMEMPDITLPSWLTQEENTSSYRLKGTLPSIEDDVSGAAASDTGAYLFHPLRFLPEDSFNDVDDIHIEVSGPYVGVVAGELLSEEKQNDRYAATFRLDRTVREADVFFGPYQISESNLALPGGDVMLRTYLLEKDQWLAKQYLDAAGQYVNRYSREIGPYPNEMFAVVSAPVPVGYAFDGLTYISEQILSHPYMLGRSLAHEVLHNWWGSGVRVFYEQGNWAEGLTTYLADHALALDEGPQAATEMRRNWLESLSSLSEDDDIALRNFVSASHSRDQSIGYGKAAMVFHGLRERLGAEVFARSLRSFWIEHEGGRANWSDLQTAFETSAGTDLNGYFQQWLDKPGLPEITLSDVQVAKTTNDFAVSFSLGQGDVPSALQIPVVIDTISGPHRERLALASKTTRFEIMLEARPTHIAIDPDFDVLRRLLEGETAVTVQDFFRASTHSVYAEPSMKESAMRLAGTIGLSGDGLSFIKVGDDLPANTTVFATGSPEQVETLRRRHFAENVPDEITAGTFQAWVEKDRLDRIWLFTIAKDHNTLPNALRNIRYYGKRSYLVSADGGRPVSGRWRVGESPLSVDLRSKTEHLSE